MGGGRVHESPQLGQSTNKSGSKNMGTSEDFSLNLLFAFSDICLHTCSTETAFQALSGIGLSIIKSVIAKVNSSGFHKGLKTQESGSFYNMFGPNPGAG